MGMGPHQFSVIALNNTDADPRAKFPIGMPAASLDDACRALMQSIALSREDHMGTLQVAFSSGNLCRLTTNEGLIDPASTVNGGAPAITRPFSLRVVFSATPVSLASYPLRMAIDGAAPVVVTRADGYALADGDIVQGRPYLIVGWAFASGALSQIRVLADALPSEVTALAQGQINANVPGLIASALNAFMPLTGGTITGDLTIQKPNPALAFLYQGVLRAAWQLKNDFRLHWVNLDNGSDYFSIGTDGSISTSQLGDLNTRIETRALANAQQQAQAYSNNCVQSMRWVYAGDMNSNYNPGTGNFIGAFGGIAMKCDHWSYDLGLGNGYCADWAHRYRYLQMYIPSQGWVTVGAVS